MDFLNMSAKAFMAYHSGMAELQQNERAILAAKNASLTGVGTFMELLQYGVENTSCSFSSNEVGQSERTEAYMNHLKEKYGVVRIENVGKDQHSLDKVGGTMGGTDVVIAPNMLEKMASDPKVAGEIEGKIDHFFSNIPKYEMEAAAMGLKFESCGCVVHEDGTVTYICGAEDPPERVAEVNRINKEKREKEAAQRKELLEKSQQAAMERQIQYEMLLRRKSIQEISYEFGIPSEIFIDKNVHFINQGVAVKAQIMMEV